MILVFLKITNIISIYAGNQQKLAYFEQFVHFSEIGNLVILRQFGNLVIFKKTYNLFHICEIWSEIDQFGHFHVIWEIVKLLEIVEIVEIVKL